MSSSARLSLVAIASAALGWIAFAEAISLGDHFNAVDQRSSVLLLAWLALGVVALTAWLAACVLAARTPAPERRRAVVLAWIAPATWLLEFEGALLWFGLEALGGPWK